MEHRNLTQHGQDGRTYGGDPGLVHIPDHHRRTVGALVANKLDTFMRERSEQAPSLVFDPRTPSAPAAT